MKVRWLILKHQKGHHPIPWSGESNSINSNWDKHTDICGFFKHPKKPQKGTTMDDPTYSLVTFFLDIFGDTAPSIVS